MDTNIICGFSGTLKSTYCDFYQSRIVVGTPTKFMLKFDRDYCHWDTMCNPMNILSARLFACKQYTDNKVKLMVERSIYDFMYYAMMFKYPGFETESCFNTRLIDGFEKEILGDRTYYIIKNNAPEFVKNTIIGSDPSRDQVYKNVDEYFSKQEDYLNFLKNYIGEYNYIELTDTFIKNVFDAINNEKQLVPWIWEKVINKNTVDEKL
jgi:hypothetical protein